MDGACGAQGAMAELAEAPQEPPSRRGRPLTFAQTKCVQLLREKEDQQNLKAVFSVQRIAGIRFESKARLTFYIATKCIQGRLALSTG